MLIRDTVAQIGELTRLVGDLVELARGDGQEEQLTVVDLDELTRHVVGVVGRNHPSIAFRIDGVPSLVRGAPGRVSRAVSNLIDNAAKWSVDGAGVEITVRDGTLTVRDHGPGVDPIDLPHIFDRFYRSRRTHDVAYGALFTTAIVGTLAQLRRPEKNVAGMVMALIPAAALLLVAVLSDDSDVVQRNPLRYAAWVMVVAALLHPAGRTFFRSFRVSRVNWAMLALIAIAAVPLIAFASTNIRLQRTVEDIHAIMGHFGFMAALCFTVIGVGLLASLRPDGWRLTAWVAGLLVALLGVTSALYPDATSSVDLIWALAAIAWGVAFVAAAELTTDAEATSHTGPPVAASKPERLVGAQARQ